MMQRRTDPPAILICTLAGLAVGLMLAPLTWRAVPTSKPLSQASAPAPGADPPADFHGHTLTLHPQTAELTISEDTAIRLPYHPRTRYVLTEIGTDGDGAPTLASWTITTQPTR